MIFIIIFNELIQGRGEPWGMRLFMTSGAGATSQIGTPLSLIISNKTEGQKSASRDDTTQWRLLKVTTPKMGIIKYIMNREQFCSTKENLILLLSKDATGNFSGWNAKWKKSAWPDVLCLIYRHPPTPPQWPAQRLFLKTHLPQQEWQHLRSGRVPVPDNPSWGKSAGHGCILYKGLCDRWERNCPWLVRWSVLRSHKGNTEVTPKLRRPPQHLKTNQMWDLQDPSSLEMQTFTAL